jgi:hypothetical protein
MGPIEHESLAALAERGFRFSMDNLTDLRVEPRELNERGFRFIKAPATLLLNRVGAPRPISTRPIFPTCSAASASISSPSGSRASHRGRSARLRCPLRPGLSVLAAAAGARGSAAGCCRRCRQGRARQDGRDGRATGDSAPPRAKSGLAQLVARRPDSAAPIAETICLPDVIERFAPLARDYDVLFCDVWGVVHNGVAAFAPACDALARFRAGGGTVILITNAPRPARRCSASSTGSACRARPTTRS